MFSLNQNLQITPCFGLQEEGRARTVVLAAVDGRLAGVLAIADPLKTEAVLAVEGLKRMGIRTVMLTGDNWSTARAIAEEVRLV
jgi:Cu+-exporting ATPase